MLAIRRLHPWLPLLALLGLLSACAPHDMEGRPLDLSKSREGYLLEGVYHNDFYQFTWKAPLGWHAVKPTPLEAMVSRPQPDQGYMFGWANPAQQAEVRLLVYPAPPGVSGGCQPQALAQAVARDNGWRALSEQPGQWQGRAATQVHYGATTGLGQPSGAVMARFVCVGMDLLVFQLQMPAMDYNSTHDLFQELLRQVQFAKTPETLARELRPPALPDMVHTVKTSGESLAAIAQWYTGNVNLAGRIQEYNQIADPSRLKPGQQIKIPGDMVTNRQPLPPPARKKPPVKSSTRKADSSEASEQGEPAALSVGPAQAEPVTPSAPVAPAESPAPPAPAPAAEPAAPTPAPSPQPAPAPSGLQLEPIGPK